MISFISIKRFFVTEIDNEWRIFELFFLVFCFLILEKFFSLFYFLIVLVTFNALFAPMNAVWIYAGLKKNCKNFLKIVPSCFKCLLFSQVFIAFWDAYSPIWLLFCCMLVVMF